MMKVRAATDALNRQLKDILETMDQEELTAKETLNALEEDIKEFEIPSFDYEKEVDFNQVDAIKRDFDVARELIMYTMDRAKKISELIMAALITDTTNITYLELAQESTKTIQNAVKTLSDLYNNYHKIVGQKKRNDNIGDGENPKDDEPTKDGGSFGTIDEEEKA